MTSWRLNFITSDESFNTSVPDSKEVGFMSIRAPKGNTSALYIPKASPNVIQAMVGESSPDWPDIQELIDYNGQFGCWVSAPPGSSTNYPSYFGGSYITNRGVFQFRNESFNTEKAVTFLVNSPITGEKAGLNVAANTALTEQLAGVDVGITANAIVISGIGADLAELITGVDLTYWTGSHSGTTYKLTLSNGQLMGAPTAIATPQQVGALSGTTLTITGTAGSGTWLYLDFNALVPTANYTTDDTLDEVSYKAALTTALLERLKWIVDIKPSTYMVVTQKSPTEIPTQITLSALGYDKWTIDTQMPAYKNLPVGAALTTLLIGGTHFVALNANNNPSYWAQGVYTLVGSVITDVTANYRTKYIKISGAGSTVGGIDTGISAADPPIIGTVYYVDITGVVAQTTTLKANPNYNQITFSVQETTPITGTVLNGGSFTGSLLPKGQNASGGNIFFPNILPDDATSLVQVFVLRPFDADVGADGFYTGLKLVDPLTSPSPVIYNIVGKRYTQNVVDTLISEGDLGGTLDDNFTPILTLGWNEFAKSNYDKVSVAMEVTGIEDLKPLLFNLRAGNRPLCSFLSARILQPSEYANDQTIVVSARLTGTGQIVNRMLRQDVNTGKTYFATLVGFAGVQYSKIIQDKLGAWAPMYQNISGGYGGQLAAVVIDQEYDLSITDSLGQQIEQTLDQIGLIPLILDPTNGVMLAGQKTTQDPTQLTDWSYFGHTMAFDKARRQIRDNVMFPQIGKPNNPYYQGVRQQQTNAILNQWTSGSSPAWQSATAIVGAVNTPAVMAARDFRLQVDVKVYVYSETVTLIFRNVAQTSSV